MVATPWEASDSQAFSRRNTADMARTTSTQRGASRRTTRTAPGGPKSRGASTSRTRKTPARTRTTPSRAKTRRPAGPWVPIAIVALVAVLAWSLYPAMRLQYLGSRRLAGVEQQYDSLKQREEAVRKEVDALSTPAGVEKAAREKLGFAKANDTVYVVSGGNTTKPAGVTNASAAGTPATPLLQQLLDFFFGFEQPSTAVEP